MVITTDSNSNSQPSWWYKKSGLHGIFENIEKKYNTQLWLLVFSVVWSFKTCSKTSVRIKTENKGSLSLFPKLLLSARYLVVYLIRIVCNVAYFAPFIGLLGLMNHYQAETKHLDPDTLEDFVKNSKSTIS